MARTGLLALGLLLAAACGGDDPVAAGEEPVDIWVSPCCFLTYTHAQTARQQSLAPGDTLELNAAYLTEAGAVRDITPGSTWTVDPAGSMSVSEGTVACAAAPNKRCRILVNLQSAPGATAVLNVEWHGNTTDLVVTTTAGT